MDQVKRRWLAFGLSAFYGTAGLLHLWQPAPFIQITPGFVPSPATVVALTGLAEIAGAAGLQIASLRKAAGLGLALYALLVWPANWNHALSGIAVGGLPQSWWYHGPRLAAQPILIVAALHAGGWRLGRTSA